MIIGGGRGAPVRLPTLQRYPMFRTNVVPSSSGMKESTKIILPYDLIQEHPNPQEHHCDYHELRVSFCDTQTIRGGNKSYHEHDSQVRSAAHDVRLPATSPVIAFV
jgi:hypothetical protein